SRPLARQRRLVSPGLVHHNGFIRVRPGHHAAVELSTRDPRAHGQDRSELRKAHPRTAEDDQPDKGEETEDHNGVVGGIEGGATVARALTRRNLPGASGRRVSLPIPAQTEHWYPHSGRWNECRRRHAAGRRHVSCQTWSDRKLRITGTRRSEVQALCPAHAGGSGVSEAAESRPSIQSPDPPAAASIAGSSGRGLSRS